MSKVEYDKGERWEYHIHTPDGGLTKGSFVSRPNRTVYLPCNGLTFDLIHQPTHNNYRIECEGLELPSELSGIYTDYTEAGKAIAYYFKTKEFREANPTAMKNAGGGELISLNSNPYGDA